MSQIPKQIKPDLKHAIRLEWWTLAWQTSIVVVMFFVMGSSQAMKSAWTEDLLGLVPAAVFLLAVHFERKSPNRKFPFGFPRVNSLAFLAVVQRARVHGALSDLRFGHQADRDGAPDAGTRSSVRADDLDRLADDRGACLFDRSAGDPGTHEAARGAAAEGQGRCTRMRRCRRPTG